jgi:cytochrome c
VIKMNDCYTCHSISNELIGPAFTAIAKKYEFNQENIDRLSKKIISGGGGVWRDVPMTPHSGLNDTDAKEAVKYILSLKK